MLPQGKENKNEVEQNKFKATCGWFTWKKLNCLDCFTWKNIPWKRTTQAGDV